MSTATGIYFDGQVARGRPVTIEFAENAALRIAGEGIAEEIALAQIRVSDRLADIPRYIYLPNEAVIETPDNAAVDSALGERRQGRGSQLIHLLESQHRIAAIACVLVVLAISVLGFYGPPALARVVAKRVPADIDQRIGTAALASISPYVRASALSAEERSRVQRQLARLLADPDLPRARLEFRSMNGGLPNAFALPGNVIIVTDELVRLPAGDDEIAAVLAHELGHLEKRHGLQGLLRRSFALLIVASVTGDLSALTSFAGSIPLTILTAGYSRDFEREADRYALELLKVHAIKPRAFATVMAKLDAAYASLKRTSTYVSTHPATEERVALFGGISSADRNAVLAESWYERASAASRANKHEEAVSHYDRVIALAPTARAHTLRAQIHFARSNHTAAEADLAKALELDPNWSEAYVTRTEVLALGARKYADAIVSGRRALELDPKNATVLATLGYAEFMQGDVVAAATDLDRAIEWDPANYRGWAYRAYLKHRTDVAGALADYDKAIELGPKRDWIYQSRGVLRNSQRNFAGALLDFNQVKDPSLLTGDFYVQRAMAQHGLGRHELAIADYGRALDKLIEPSHRTTVRMNRASAFEGRGNYRSAIVDYSAVLESDPKNRAIQVRRAIARRRLGEAADALADIEKAMEGHGDDVALLRERGNIHWDLGDYTAALRDFDRVLEQRADPIASRARSMIHFSLGDWERAEADLRALPVAAKSRPVDYAEFFRLLVRRRASKDDQQAAFAATVAQWPKSWPRSIGEYLAGNITEQKLLAEINVGQGPPPNQRRCEAHFYIGQMHLLAGERTLAKQYFEQCVSTGAFTYYEYKLARAELARLQQSE